MRINYINSKKISLKNLSLVITLIFSLSLITIPLLNVKAETTNTRPSFNVELNADKNIASVGDEITVSGKIIPNDFEFNIQEKEVVLVLDVSSSMNEDGHDRLSSLKTAVNKFLDIVKDVPNLKIAVVAYSTDAFVNPKENIGQIDIQKYKENGDKNNQRSTANYSLYTQTFFSSNNESDRKCLVNMINILQANGGTSTGEGLRQAEYILEKEGNEKASKNIIFMTDGIPSYYTVDATHNEFYTQIDNKTIRGDGEPFLGGSGSTSDSSDIKKATNYATIIGNLIKQNTKPNVYSIGYELDKDGEANLSDIHKSMGGEDKNFVCTDMYKIEAVFSQIASKIATEYESNNMSMDLKLPDNFTKGDISYFSSNDGGKSLQPISNQVVKYVGEEDSTKTKMIYKADPVYFSFKVTGSEAGKFKLFGSNNSSVINLNFKDLENGKCSSTIPELDITLNDYNLPQINADLNTMDSSKTYSVGDSIDVNYTIKPKPFKYEGNEVNADSNTPKDVVFVIDTSKLMENKLVDLARAIKNKIILNKNKDRFSIITYDSSFRYHKLDDYKNLSEVNNFINNGESNYSNAVASMLETIASNKVNDLKNENSTDKSNLSGALIKAEDILENGRGESLTEKIDEGRAPATKNIVIIGAENIDLNSELDNEISNIQQKSYNLITFNIGDVNKELKQPDNNLRELHYKLTNNMSNSAFSSFSKDAKNKYYINIDYRKLQQISDDKLLEDSNNYNQSSWIEDPVMVKINNDLLGGKLKQKLNSYSFYPKLKFNIGDDFSVDSGLTKAEDSTYEYETTDSCTVVYTLQSDGTYTAPESTISFKIKPKNAGNLKFNTPNDIVYCGIKNDEIKNSIQTPVINIVNKMFPQINAEVVNPPTVVNLADERRDGISLEYKIEPQSFNQDSISNNLLAKDVVFALDISKTEKFQGNGNWADEDIKIQQVKQALFDNLTNNSEIKNAKYGIVTYSNPSEVNSSQKLMDPKEVADKIKDISQSNKGGSKVSVGESEALKILRNYSENNHAKYIIIISSGKANAKNHLGVECSTVDNASIGKYNRIALDLSDNTESISDEVNFIFDKIKKARVPSYIFKTKLKFNTGGNFSKIVGNDTLNNTTSDLGYDVETQEFDVKYDLNENNGEYVAPESYVTFKIQVNKTAIITEGKLEFGDQNNENDQENKFPGAVSYENLLGVSIYNRINPFSISINNSNNPPVTDELPDLF